MLSSKAMKNLIQRKKNYEAQSQIHNPLNFRFGINQETQFKNKNILKIIKIKK